MHVLIHTSRKQLTITQSTKSSLVPRPHPPKEEKGLVNFGSFLGFIGRVVVTNLRSDWSMPPRGRFKLTPQSCMSPKAKF